MGHPGSVMEPGRIFIRSFPWLLPHIGQAQQIVRRGIVKPRQADQDIRGDIPLASLVVAIDSLRAG